jgi:murein DD-endopeptidase MepM/ murein hydrolase activator NlpD
VDYMFNPIKLTGLVLAVMVTMCLCAVGGTVLGLVPIMAGGVQANVQTNERLRATEEAWLSVAGGSDPTALAEWFGGYVTSGFHCAERPGHNGVDFGLVVGTPIRATQSGEVIVASGGHGDYGTLVVIQHGAYSYYYAHLSVVRLPVGGQVETGDVVGLSGNSGVSTGPHLHYEVRCEGVPIDPATAPVGVLEEGVAELPDIDEVDLE